MLTNDDLRAARTGLAVQIEKCKAMIAEIDAKLEKSHTQQRKTLHRHRSKKAASGRFPVKPARKWSPEGRARIAEATRKRWEAFRESRRQASNVEV